MAYRTNDVGSRLMADLQKAGFSRNAAAGVVGNLSHETAGFTKLQEMNPTVPGSRGGFGYAQWTGPRRRAFEEYAKTLELDPNSYGANLGFLKKELASPEYKGLMEQLNASTNPAEAATLVSNKYERPGVPHMGSRVRYAEAYADPNAIVMPAGGQAPIAMETAGSRLSGAGPMADANRVDMAMPTRPTGAGPMAGLNRVTSTPPSQVPQSAGAPPGGMPTGMGSMLQRYVREGGTGGLKAGQLAGPQSISQALHVPQMQSAEMQLKKQQPSLWQTLSSMFR